MALSGGIDIGGTKIEASVFDETWQPVKTRRVPTPKQDYDELVDAVVLQAEWLKEQSNDASLPIGIGIPGLHNAKTGAAFTSNLPATGFPLRSDVKKRIGTHVGFGNDCDLFALSEAVLGAGVDNDTVFGLILGTGIGGGICYDGKLLETFNGAAGEVGHLRISGALMQEFDLPVLQCGCGRMGCNETLASGPGMSRLAEMFMGEKLEASEIAAQSAAGVEGAQRVMEIWRRIIVELICDLQLTVDPDCVVIGGGLSNIPNLAEFVAEALPDALLTGSTPPAVMIAKYGDSSGTRGAALAATIEGNR